MAGSLARKRTNRIAGRFKRLNYIPVVIVPLMPELWNIADSETNMQANA